MEQLTEQATDYGKCNVEQLRSAAKAAGWKGAGRYDASKGELLTFLDTGTKPPSRDELLQTIAELKAHVEKLTSDLTGNSNNRERRKGAGRGRPKAELPEDVTPFVFAIGEAHGQGRPFRKTSVLGVFMRREELPAPFNVMGKHSLERLVSDLLTADRLQIVNGYLSA